MRRALCAGLGVVLLAALPAQAESPPMPPHRPFDLDKALATPRLFAPPPAPAAAAGAAPGGVPAPPPSASMGQSVQAPLPPSRPTELSSLVEPDDDAPIATPNVPDVPPPVVPPAEQPASTDKEWPRRTPGQVDDAETAPVDDTPTGPGITTDPGTSIACLPERLKTVLNKVVALYGSVRVTSTYRPAWRARRGSYHRRCEAVDFRVPGHRPGEVLGVVKHWEETGGRKVYWNGLLHVDTGPIRSW